jgi:hypothetical protein
MTYENPLMTRTVAKRIAVYHRVNRVRMARRGQRRLIARPTPAACTEHENILQPSAFST